MRGAAETTANEGDRRALSAGQVRCRGPGWTERQPHPYRHIRGMRSCWSGEDSQLVGDVDVTVVVRYLGTGIDPSMWHANGTTGEERPGAGAKWRRPTQHVLLVTAGNRSALMACGPIAGRAAYVRMVGKRSPRTSWPMAMAWVPVTASGEVRHGGAHALAEGEHAAEQRFAEPVQGASNGSSAWVIGPPGGRGPRASPLGVVAGRG